MIASSTLNYEMVLKFNLLAILYYNACLPSQYNIYIMNHTKVMNDDILLFSSGKKTAVQVIDTFTNMESEVNFK